MQENIQSLLQLQHERLQMEKERLDFKREMAGLPKKRKIARKGQQQCVTDTFMVAVLCADTTHHALLYLHRWLFFVLNMLQQLDCCLHPYPESVPQIPQSHHHRLPLNTSCEVHMLLLCILSVYPRTALST